jgi:excisionase family DNA binding protein
MKRREPQEEKPDRYLPVRQVAETLCCMNQYVYTLIREGRLTAIRIGSRAIRISEKSLSGFINSNKVDPDQFNV